MDEELINNSECVPDELREYIEVIWDIADRIQKGK